MNALPLWRDTEAEAATHGHSTRPWQATGVSIDSRTVAPGDLFVAIRGPRFDAHDFLDEAFERGAAAALVNRIPRGHDGERPLLIVEDTYTGLKQLARAARRRADARIVAVTGSVGKTSTKEALGRALGASGRVTTSRGNLNNLWGVPLSVARMPEASDYGVFEIGMNHAGEITPLSRIVRPEVAIITTIEAVHIEFFDSIEGIARAKAEIFDGLRKGGTAVLNGDNPHYDLLREEAGHRGIRNIVSFGENAGNDARLLSYAPGRPAMVEADIMGTKMSFGLALPGRHSAMNAMAVLAAVKLLGADLQAGGEALSTMDAPEGRGRRMTVALPGGGTATVIDDSYNASPASMRAAFRVLGAAETGANGRRIAVLGDMLELGHGSARAHEGLAEDLVEAGVNLVLTTGANMMHLDDALPRRLRGGHTARAADLVTLLERTLSDGDVVLIKASNSQGLGEVVRALALAGNERRNAAGGE